MSLRNPYSIEGVKWLLGDYLHPLALQFLASTLQGLDKDVLIPPHSKRHPISLTMAPAQDLTRISLYSQAAGHILRRHVQR